MSKIIMVFARCKHSSKGDYTLAGSIAADLVTEMKKSNQNIQVVLASMSDSIAKFESLYGKPVEGRVVIDGNPIQLCTLETFDTVNNQVVAFIDANHCQYPPADILKRVLDPETKFLLIGAADQRPVLNKSEEESIYETVLKTDQPGIYEHFSIDDFLMKISGCGEGQIGISNIKKAEDLPELSIESATKIPNSNFGVVYLKAKNIMEDVSIISQYMKLSRHPEYIIIGNAVNRIENIKMAYEYESQIQDVPLTAPFPAVHFHKSLEYPEMRRMIARASGPLITTTGIMSVFEAMHDKKLVFYQCNSTNATFVISYFSALRSFCSSDASLSQSMMTLMLELTKELFNRKPLTPRQMKTTNELLGNTAVVTSLIAANQAIINKANGKLASQLLTFINKPNRTQVQQQLTSVCISLRKPGETTTPSLEQALRRATAWGRIFEMKVLLRSMTSSQISACDVAGTQRSALHWSVIENRPKCLQLLLLHGADLSKTDKEGNTPLQCAATLKRSECELLLSKADPSTRLANCKP